MRCYNHLLLRLKSIVESSINPLHAKSSSPYQSSPAYAQSYLQSHEPPLLPCQKIQLSSSHYSSSSHSHLNSHLHSVETTSTSYVGVCGRTNCVFSRVESWTGRRAAGGMCSGTFGLGWKDWGSGRVGLQRHGVEHMDGGGQGDIVRRWMRSSSWMG